MADVVKRERFITKNAQSKINGFLQNAVWRMVDDIFKGELKDIVKIDMSPCQLCDKQYVRITGEKNYEEFEHIECVRVPERSDCTAYIYYDEEQNSEYLVIEDELKCLRKDN